MKAFFGERKRRGVLRVALAYVVVAWVVLQVISVLAPLLDLPPWVGKAVLLVCVAGFPIALVLSWVFEFGPKGLSRTGDVAAAVAPPKIAPEARTIAVLPFVNLSSEPEQDYFSDGLSEELMNQLAQIPALRVTGRTSAFVFKGHAEDLRTIGDKLGVANILEGSVRKAGSQLRIAAQLVNAADGYRLWSESYVRELDDVFAIQESVARAVTSALGVTLGISETRQIAGGTSSLEAYDKYLRARALFYQSGHDELVRAVELYREALALDPRFALAWYGLYSALGYGLVMDPGRAADTRKEMEEASVRILALAPDAWWTHAMRADQFLLQHRWAEAEAEANAALAAAPPFEVDALVTGATFQMYVGRIGDAVRTFERARAADPLSLRISGFLQVFLDLANRRDEAHAEFERSRGLAGGRGRWEWAAVLRLLARDKVEPAEVNAQFQSCLQIGGAQVLPVFRKLAHEWQQPEAARATLRAAFDDSAYQDPSAMTAIFLYADLVRDRDLALRALRRAFVEMKKVNFEGLWWPFVTNLRTDPRFKDIVREIGLVDYWRVSGNWGDFARPIGSDDFEVYR